MRNLDKRESKIISDLLHLSNQALDFRLYLKELSSRLAAWTGCEAVGIRLTTARVESLSPCIPATDSSCSQRGASRRRAFCRWPIILLVLVCLSSLTRAESRVVKVGIYQNPPKVFTDESGRQAGIFIDILEHIAKDEGWTLEYIPGTWDLGLRRLASGEIDLMPDVAFNADRAKAYRFHEVSVLSSWSQIYAAKESEIQSILDLNDKIVAVLSGSVQQEAFANLAGDFGLSIRIEAVSDYAAAFQAVKDGRADAAIANNFFGLMNARKFELKDTAVVFMPSQLYFAAHPDPADPFPLDRIDAHLRRMKKDPQSPYYESLKRWTSDEVAFAFPLWAKVAGLCAGIVLLMSLAGSIVLKRQVNSRTRDLSARNEQMVAIDKALRSTTTQLNLQPILENALHAALELTKIESGILYLLDKETGRLVPKSAIQDGVLREAAEPMEDPIAEDFMGGLKSWGGRNRILWERPPGETSSERESNAGEGITFFAGFPLRVRDNSIGALCLLARDNHKPEPRLLDLVEDICAPVALAIENARLFEEVKNHEAELTEQVAERTRELERAMERALAADRIKSAFLATMSHELRTPLNAIIGFTGILLKELAGPLNDEQHKQLAMVQGSSRHLLSLINDVLDISKIEAGQLELQAETFALKQSIDKVASMVAPMAEKKGIEVRVNVGDGVENVNADRRRMEQVMLNLVNNAVKFTESGHVTMACRRDGDEYVFTVADTGIGISKDDMAGLFQPFHQVDSGIARKHEGTGLGLSICKKLLDMMGGDIGVESEPGRGSTFTVRFPLQMGGEA